MQFFTVKPKENDANFKQVLNTVTKIHSKHEQFFYNLCSI